LSETGCSTTLLDDLAERLGNNRASLGEPWRQRDPGCARWFHALSQGGKMSEKAHHTASTS
jgi:hypothetical protein